MSSTDRLWVPAWAALAVGLCLLVSLGPLEGVPHVQDEVVYQWQADLLAQGSLSLDVPQPVGSRGYHFLLDLGGQRFGAFPSGWPLLLALGSLIGLPFLINPLLQGLTVLLGGRLGERLVGAGPSRLVAPVLALSPQLVLLGASRMSHTLVAVLALGLAVLIERRQLPASLGAGGLLGCVLLTRPLDALVLGCVAAAWLLATGRGRELLPLAVGPVLGLAVQLGLNEHITGSWSTFPVSAYFEGPPPTNDPGWRYEAGCNALGFGADRGCFPTWGELGHTPLNAAQNAGKQLLAAGRLWLGALPLLLVPLLAWRDQRLRPLLLVGGALWLLCMLGYALYWVPGAAYGARFHHMAAPLVLIAAALGWWSWPRLPHWARWLLLVPLLARGVSTLPELTSYWGVDGRYAELERRWEGGPALVLVGYSGPAMSLGTPQTTGSENEFGARFWRGSWIGRRGDLVYAEYQPELVEALQRSNPGLKTWLYVHHADRNSDQLIPIEMMAPSEQLDALRLPVDPFEMARLPAPVLPRAGPLP